MVKQLLAAILLGCLAALPASAAATDEPPIGTLEVEIEALPEMPYEQEMILLSIRGYYPRSVVRQSLEQPEMENFGWTQLGRDHWEDSLHDGRQVSAFLRRMAIFPQRSGKLELGAFLHRVTLLDREGRRIEHEIRSQPLAIEVQPAPAPATPTDGDAGWWLPARGITVTDVWDHPPDQLELGQVARRTVTLEVEGVGPELLPPAPELRASGAIIFTDPEERSRELTKKGPVSTVTWRWSLRTMSSVPVMMEAVTIPWFDTTRRENREIELAPGWIALAGTLDEPLEEDSLLDLLAGRALPLGLLAGLLGGLLLLLPGLRLRSRAELARLLARLRPDPDVAALRRAARAGDARGLWGASRRLLRRDREEGRAGALPARLQSGLAGLDRHLFGPGKPKESFDFRTFARDFLRRRGLRRNKMAQ